jgi:formylmethanofuran dehydrogenase subunit E
MVAETDRCLPDVVELVICCRLGNRSLIFKDWGKMPASFPDLTRNRAFRVAAQESIEAEALRSFKGLPREESVTEAYTNFADEKLFKWQPAIVKYSPEDLPGHRVKRGVCERCVEGIGIRREVHMDALTLCRVRAGEAYWLSGGTA